jgi:hypothetical protein
LLKHGLHAGRDFVVDSRAPGLNPLLDCGSAVLFPVQHGGAFILKLMDLFLRSVPLIIFSLVEEIKNTAQLLLVAYEYFPDQIATSLVGNDFHQN